MSEKLPNIDEWAESQETIPYQAESNLEKFLKNYAAAGAFDEVSADDFGKKLPQQDIPKMAFFKTDENTFLNERWNFGIYNPDTKKWKKVKLTVNKRPEIVDKMALKYKEKGIELMDISFSALKNAANTPVTNEPNSFQEHVFEKLKDILHSEETQV